MRHSLKRENGVCSGLWSWKLLILERTSPWHCLWCQLQCICHQVYRFLNLLPFVSSIWWHMNAQVRATLPAICEWCVASYQPPPSYFYPTGKTRASMPTEHWCEITQNTAPRLASSPRQNSHMQCQPRGRVYNVISPTTPGAWILLLSGTKKQNSV